MMLSDKLYPKNNISIHKKKHYNFQYEQSAESVPEAKFPMSIGVIGSLGSMILTCSSSV
jgi:hypothetical protein